MSLKDIQLVSLEILNVIDEFCRNHDINYSLGYGSLIGAVRHNGCIPWDDDIDIMMLRDDYNRFVNLFRCEGYKLYAPELHNCYHAIARICDMNKTRVFKYYKWNDEKNGVWIDLFPYDRVPSDGGNLIRSKADYCYAICKGHAGVSFRFGIEQNIENIKNFILHGWQDRKCAIQKYMDALSKDRNDSIDVLRNYASPYNKKDIHKYEVFERYIRVPFEKQEAQIIYRYDDYLTSLYGDYMQLPPIEKQIRGHNKNKFYWV